MSAGVVNVQEPDLWACLDHIWQAKTPRLNAARECIQRRPGVIPEAVAFDLSSYLEIVPKRITVARGTTIVLVAERGTFEFELSATPGIDSVITYTGLLRHVRVIGRPPVVVLATKNQSFDSLLCGLQLCRDHIDSLLYLPSAMRQDRLEEFATESGMGVSQFRFLAAHFSTIQRSVVLQP